MNFNELPRVGRRDGVHDIDSNQRRKTSLWVGIGAAVLGAGASIYTSKQSTKAANKALDAQRGIATDIKYEPIDIEKLKASATKAATENAVASLALERSLQPDVANTRAELSRQIGSDLTLGGQLPADVINRVTTAGRVAGARSGNGSGTSVPLTASLLGLSSIDLLNSRRAAASNLLANNPLQPAGLDPGQLASVEIANNNALNQFNLEGAGVESNLVQSEANARAAQIGGQVGTASSLANLLGQGIGAYQSSRAGIGEKTTYDEFLKKNAPVMTSPSYKPVQTSGFFT